MIHSIRKTFLTVLLVSALLLSAGCSSNPEPSGGAPAQNNPADTTTGDKAPSSPSSEETAQKDANPSEASAPAILGNFTATDLEGNAVNQDIFADHDLTMINIWATFCGPCLSEMPELGEIHTEYQDKGVQVVGVVMDVLSQDGTFSDSQIATAKEIVEKTGASYLHLLPSEDLIYAVLGEVTAVPETIFVDKNGSLVGKTYMGAKSKDNWLKIIEQNLELVKGAE